MEVFWVILAISAVAELLAIGNQLERLVAEVKENSELLEEKVELDKQKVESSRSIEEALFRLVEQNND